MDQFHTCVICHRAFDSATLLPLDLLRTELYEKIEADCAIPIDAGHICREDLAKYVPALPVDPEESEWQMFADKADIQTAYTFSDRCSDRMTSFVGSWSFLFWFCAFLIIWTLLNTYLVWFEKFDPYPFVFLNLVLAVITSLQAPMILMSQNRQAELDRIRATYHYAVDLKTEVEVRQIKKTMQQILRAIKK